MTPIAFDPSRVVTASLLAAVLGAWAVPAAAQSGATSDATSGATGLDAITVTATRGGGGRPISAIPGSVTIIEREEIDRQAVVSQGLGDLLGQFVPGFGLSTQSASNYGQQMRGRDFLVLIDGVPQSTPLRSASRDLNTIDLSAVERIEVIRGSAATYGYGATGGTINIITRAAEGGGPNFRTELGLNLSLSHPADSLGGEFVQNVSGAAGRLDYSLTASGEKIGGYFDADGDRIPPDPYQQTGLSDSTVRNLHGKVGLRLTDDQRLQLSALYYDQEQDTDYSTDLTNAFGRPTGKVRAIPGSPPGENTGTENLVLNLEHSIADVLGSDVTLQAYYQDYETVNAYYLPNRYQSSIASKKLGLRAAVETPLPSLGGATITWGADYLSDETGQPLLSTAVPLPAGTTYVPDIEQTSIAPFLQLEVPVGERLLLRGGVRYETMELDIPTFTNTRVAGGVLVPYTTVQGGQLRYQQAVYNLGAVYTLTDEMDVFAGFSQGFSVADIGRLLRATNAPSVDVINPEAQVVDNYEIGLRGDWGAVEGSVTLFLSTSDLGSTYAGPPNFDLQRQKEEVYGVETTFAYRPSALWAAGGTFTWYEGETDTNADGELDRYLDGTRIAPAKLTLFGEYNPFPEWRNRLQLLAVADRDRFDGTRAFEGEVDGFVTLDLISELDAGPGTLKLGIENLLNRQYITPVGQASNIQYAYAAARGARASIRYAIRY